MEPVGRVQVEDLEGTLWPRPSYSCKRMKCVRRGGSDGGTFAHSPVRGDESCLGHHGRVKEGRRQDRADEEGRRYKSSRLQVAFCLRVLQASFSRHPGEYSANLASAQQPVWRKSNCWCIKRGAVLVSACVRSSGHPSTSSVKYLSQTAAALISICQALHYAPVNIKPFFRVVKKVLKKMALSLSEVWMIAAAGLSDR